MDPQEVALILPLILQGLDLAIKLAPEVVQLVEAIKAAIASKPESQEALALIASDTIALSAETRQKLLALLQQ